jgi:hypothetical protein
MIMWGFQFCIGPSETQGVQDKKFTDFSQNSVYGGRTVAGLFIFVSQYTLYMCKHFTVIVNFWRYFIMYVVKILPIGNIFTTENITYR